MSSSETYSSNVDSDRESRSKRRSRKSHKHDRERKRRSSHSRKHSRHSSRRSLKSIYKRKLCMDVEEEYIKRKRRRSSYPSYQSPICGDPSTSQYGSPMPPMQFVALMPANFFPFAPGMSGGMPQFAPQVMQQGLHSSSSRHCAIQDYGRDSGSPREGSYRRSSSLPRLLFQEDDHSDDASCRCSRCEKKRIGSGHNRCHESHSKHSSPEKGIKHSPCYECEGRGEKKEEKEKPERLLNTSASNFSGQYAKEEPKDSWKSPASNRPDHSAPYTSTPFSRTVFKKRSFPENDQTPPIFGRSFGTGFGNKRRRVESAAASWSAPAKLQKPRYTFSTSTVPFDLLSYQSEIGFIDTHCHLDFLFNKLNFEGNHSKFQEQRGDYPVSFKGCITCFCDPSTFKKRSMWRSIIDENGVWGAFGCHPHYSDQFDDEVEEDLKAAVNFDQVIAFGEIGMDFSVRKQVDSRTQADVFRRQLKILKELDRQLPLLIHCREAHNECFSILQEEMPADYPMHLHCFTEPWPKAEMWLNTFSRLYIGVTNLVTKNEAREVHDLVRNIPLDRVLLETDAPYFVPNDLKNAEQWSHPGMAIHVAAEISRLKGITLKDTLEAVMKNTKLLYQI